jgi:metacaspase-1
MPRGIALHVGLNAVEPRHYASWEGELVACEHDARDMRALADSLGYQTTLLLGRKATWDAVTRAIGAVGQSLAAGDVFLLTYAGHGAHLAQRAGARAHGRHAAWALFDRLLLGVELRALFAEFERDVRIVLLADACRNAAAERTYRALHAALPDFALGAEAPRFRTLPVGIAGDTWAMHQHLYDAVENEHRAGGPLAIVADVLVLSACQENQLAAESRQHGRFTEALTTVWQDGRFEGDWRDLHRALQHAMPPWQSPSWAHLGSQSAAPARRPFDI